MDGFSFIEGDVCNLHTQTESIKGIDCVVFLAEIVGDPSCEYLPQTALKTNYLAVNSMATLCAHANINRFIYTSSCSVYGASANPEDLLNEESALSPVSHYARMKILSEQTLFNQLNPLFSPTILRLATVFGHSHRPRFDLVVNAFAKNAYYDESLTVYGGNQWRPNVHVKDVARSIIKVIDAPLNIVKKETFNVGSNSENYTIKSLSELTKKVFQDCTVHVDDSNPDKRNYRIDFSKIKEILGFDHKYSVKDGLKELKEVFELELINKVNDKKHSNIQTFMDRDLHEY
jgi:nucleoside-diphosphate-sugar epimerase